MKGFKKKIISRALRGFPLGVAWGYFTTILLSWMWGTGDYYPCTGSLIQFAGNEINAVLLQAVLFGLVGSGFAAGTVVWGLERWSLAKQQAVYFCITALIMFPIAYFANWMEHTLIGFLIYFGIFTLIFFTTWTLCYFFCKYRLKKINQKLPSAYDSNKKND